MNNIFIIDRCRYNEFHKDEFTSRFIGGLPSRVMMLLDHFIIEEEDGSAIFLKNRSNGKTHMPPHEYREFKKNI